MLKPLFRAKTRGRYLVILKEDRQERASVTADQGTGSRALMAKRCYLDTSAYLCILLGENGHAAVEALVSGSSSSSSPT